MSFRLEQSGRARSRCAITGLLTQIFKGVMPFLFCVILSMVLMYVFPQIVFYLPELFYGK